MAAISSKKCRRSTAFLERRISRGSSTSSVKPPAATTGRRRRHRAISTTPPRRGSWPRARVVPYLDLPVQHGDDGVLRAMRRAVTAKRMKEIVGAFREAIPGLTVRTTVLVGFPGESEAAFQNLLEFLDETRFDRLGVFTYSPEDGTPSPGFPDQVPAEVATERAA